jgi:hypothetical protein
LLLLWASRESLPFSIAIFSGGVDVLGDNDLFCADVLNHDRCGAFHVLRPHTNSSLTLSADTSPSVDSSATLGS